MKNQINFYTQNKEKLNFIQLEIRIILNPKM
jgi:hypothetical protein